MGNAKLFGSPWKREFILPWHKWGWEGAAWLTRWIPEAEVNSQYEIFFLAWKPLVLIVCLACGEMNASYQLECTWFHKSAPAQQSPGMSLYMHFIFGCKIREPFNSSWFARINWSGRITLTQLSTPQMNSALTSINDLAQPLKTG